MSIKRISDLPKLPVNLADETTQKNTLFEVSTRDTLAANNIMRSFSISGQDLINAITQAILNMAIGDGKVDLNNIVWTDDTGGNTQYIKKQKVFEGSVQIRNELRFYGQDAKLILPNEETGASYSLSGLVIKGTQLDAIEETENAYAMRNIANARAIVEYINGKNFITEDDLNRIVGSVDALQSFAALLNKVNLQLYVDYANGKTIQEIDKYVLVKVGSASANAARIPLSYTIDSGTVNFEMLYFKNIQDAMSFANRFKFLEKSKLYIYICRDMPLKALVPTFSPRKDSSGNISSYIVTDYSIKDDIYIEHPDLTLKDSLIISGLKHKSIRAFPKKIDYDISTDGTYITIKPETTYFAVLKNTYDGDNYKDEDVKKIFFQGYLFTDTNKAVIRCSQAVRITNIIFDGFNGPFKHITNNSYIEIDGVPYDIGQYSYNDHTYYLLTDPGVLAASVFKNIHTPTVVSNTNINGIAMENCNVGLIGSQAGIGQNIITEYACTSCINGISLNGGKFAKSNGHSRPMYIEAKNIIAIGGAGNCSIVMPGQIQPSYYKKSTSDARPDDKLSNWTPVYNDLLSYWNDSNFKYRLAPFNSRIIYSKLSTDADNVKSIDRVYLSVDSTNKISESTYQNFCNQIFDRKPNDYDQFNDYLKGGFIEFQLVNNNPDTIVNSSNYLSSYTYADDYSDYSAYISKVNDNNGYLKPIYESNRYKLRRGYGYVLSNVNGVEKDVEYDFRYRSSNTGACPDIGHILSIENNDWKYWTEQAAWYR